MVKKDETANVTICLIYCFRFEIFVYWNDKHWLKGRMMKMMMMKTKKGMRCSFWNEDDEEEEEKNLFLNKRDVRKLRKIFQVLVVPSNHSLGLAACLDIYKGSGQLEPNDAPKQQPCLRNLGSATRRFQEDVWQKKNWRWGRRSEEWS